MEKTKYYLDMFRDEILNSIMNSPTNDETINYLKDCLTDAYQNTLDALKNEI